MSGCDLLTGAVAGFVVAILWGVTAWVVRWWRQRRDFGVLDGTYRRYGKLGDEPEPESVSITVDGNVLEVEWHGLPDGDSVKGWIAMNEQFRTSGEGHYEHVKNGRQLWGFWKVQKNADTLLVHTTYAHYENDVAVVQGHEWRRVR
ncbi:MAG: hypothetical protein ABI783_08520 [Actinomycetota bacterium]